MKYAWNWNPTWTEARNPTITTPYPTIDGMEENLHFKIEFIEQAGSEIVTAFEVGDEKLIKNHI